MKKKLAINSWREYYQALSEDRKKQVFDEIKKELAISKATFYKKLDSLSFSPSDKKAIAAICQVPVHFIFP